MRWYISVFSGDGKELLFARKCPGRHVAELLASMARSERPDVRIYLRDPRGEVTQWR